jgi:anti-sigma B factor antagonist
MARSVVIAPEGELDLHASRALSPQLSAAAEQSDLSLLVVDLSAVTFIDSSGLGAILQAHRRLSRQGRRVTVVVPKGSAAAVVLELAGLSSVLTLAQSREAALQPWATPEPTQAWRGGSASSASARLSAR